jgi:SAM-dependent methyltransferase
VKRRVWIWLAVALVAAGYFWIDVRQRARVDRGLKRHRTDFTVYQAAAQALKRGEDPYEARNPRGYRYVYPPLLAVLLQPVANWEPQNAALVFYALSVLAIVGSVLLLRRIAGGRWSALVAAAIVCLGFAHQGFQRGQVTHILLYLQVAALALLLGRRYAWAGLLLGFGGALRLTPLLPAFAVGIGLLAGVFTRRGVQPPLRFGGGLAGGMLLGFVLIPVLWLGAERASEVGDRWIDVTQQVYSQNVDLDADYKINEWRFKNQAPRRVYGTWAGWLWDVPFEGERPQLGPTSLAGVDLAAGITTWALVVLALALGLAFLRDTAQPAYALVFALVVLLPVLMTRYAWPTHYLMAAPALVVVARRDWFARPVGVLFLGTLLFYAAHSKALEPIGQAGCLFIACVLFLALLVVGLRPRERRRESILLRYRGGGWRTRLYRSLRLAHGGFESLARHLPRGGTIVDLGAGAGLLAHVLVTEEPTRHVLAVDHSVVRTRALRVSARGLPIEVRDDSMEALVFPRCRGVALVDVLHYLPADDQRDLLARCAHALEPGGVLVLRDPDAHGGWRFRLARLHERIATRFGWTQASLGRFRSIHGWAAQLEEQGLVAEVLPRKPMTPYADRTVIGRRP